MKRKGDVMLYEDEPLFKKHKHFASVLTVSIINTCVILSYIHLIIVIQYYYHI